MTRTASTEPPPAVTRRLLAAWSLCEHHLASVRSHAAREILDGGRAVEVA